MQDNHLLRQLLDQPLHDLLRYLHLYPQFAAQTQVPGLQSLVHHLLTDLSLLLPQLLHLKLLLLLRPLQHQSAQHLSPVEELSQGR